MKPEDFGRYLKELRQIKKLTMRQLDLYSGVSHSYISQMERGIRGIPSPDILQKLSKPLGVEYEELMKKAGYLGVENEAVDLINKLLYKFSDSSQINNLLKELGSNISFGEFIKERSLEEKIELFFALTANLKDVHISINEDGSKEIDLIEENKLLDIEDEQLVDKLPLSYRGMELTREEKVEFLAIARAIYDARRGPK